VEYGIYYTTDDSSLLGCGAVSLGKWFWTFLRLIVPDDEGIRMSQCQELLASDRALHYRRLESSLNFIGKF
jgi:hypothetical protein